MKRHAFDATSFIFGVVLAASAIGFFLAAQNEWDVDGRWVLPAVLIVLGIAGIAGAVSGLLPGSRSDDLRSDDDDAPAAQADTTTP